MENCNGFGETDLANKIHRLKLILDIVQIRNGPKKNAEIKNPIL